MKNTTVTAEEINSALKVLQNPSLVLSNKNSTISIYHRVAQQPDVFSKAQNYKDGICAMQLNSTDDFFQTYLEEKTINTRELIRWAISARDYGFAVIEIIEYAVVSGKTVPSKFKLCKPEKFVIGVKGELRYINSTSGPQGIDIQEKYPNKFIWLRNEPSDISPYGIALYDLAYWLAVGLNGNFEAIMKFAEYDGADKWVGYHNPDATQEQKTELLTMLLTLKSNGVAAVPKGSEITAIEYKGRSSTNNLYNSIDEMLLRKLENLWFGTALLMQVDGKEGYNSSNIGFKVREDAIAQGVYLVMECFKQIHQYIEEINGSAHSEIELSMTATRNISLEEAQVDEIYFGMGLKPNKTFFINRGYKEGEFELGESKVPTKGKSAEFRAKAKQLDELFEIYRSPK